MNRVMLGLLVAASVCGSAHAVRYARALDLVNRSHTPVSSFYASNVGNDQWDENLLARRALLPNHFVQLELKDSAGVCRFDFKTEFADGTSVIRRNVNVCVLRTYALTD
jgi:hypothetical protein